VTPAAYLGGDPTYSSNYLAEIHFAEPFPTPPHANRYVRGQGQRSADPSLLTVPRWTQVLAIYQLELKKAGGQGLLLAGHFIQLRRAS
jgi:hypothetical protein